MSLGHFMSHNFIQEECFDFVDILSQSPWVDKIARSTEAWGDIYELKYMSITYMPWSIQQSLKLFICGHWMKDFTESHTLKIWV